MAERASLKSPAARLALLGLLALLACALFLTLGARGSWSFVLAYRGQKLAALVIVAVAIAVSSVLFQTVSENRILTPALMGFDALYALLQTVLVFTLGSAAVGAIEPRLLFLGEVGAMPVAWRRVMRKYSATGPAATTRPGWRNCAPGWQPTAWTPLSSPAPTPIRANTWPMPMRGWPG